MRRPVNWQLAWIGGTTRFLADLTAHSSSRGYRSCVALPTMTPAQRLEASTAAAHARRRRAEVCARLKAGQVSLAEVLEKAQTDPALAKLRVVALLEAMPGIGKAKADAVLGQCGISRSRRLRGLGPHQRGALLAAFK